MDWTPLAKRLGRTGGLACMIAGALLCGVMVVEAIEICPGEECEAATLNAATYALIFCFGGIVWTWGRRP